MKQTSEETNVIDTNCGGSLLLFQNNIHQGAKFPFRDDILCRFSVL